MHEKIKYGIFDKFIYRSYLPSFLSQAKYASAATALSNPSAAN